MSVFGVNFNNPSYNSKFGSFGLQQMTKVKSQDKKNDTDIFKATKKRNKKKSILTTLALVAATAFATYKGKNVISGGINKVTKAASTTAKRINFSSKFPNLSQAGKSLKEAFKTPAKPFITLAKNIKKHFHK